MPQGEDAEAILRAVARTRGFFQKGQDFDLEKAAQGFDGRVSERQAGTVYSGDSAPGGGAFMKPTQKQLERIGRMTAHDQEYIDLYGAVCGMDEAGRGPKRGRSVLPASACPWRI